MITDRQWNIFAQHVKPNATIEYETCVQSAPNTFVWIKEEGFLIENFPFSQDLDRIREEGRHASYSGLKSWNHEGRYDMGDPVTDVLRIQLCNRPYEFVLPPRELRYWVKGEFLEFDDILALGDAK
jgi:hypothetical protein